MKSNMEVIEQYFPKILEQQLNFLRDNYKVESWKYNNCSQTVLSIRFSNINNVSSAQSTPFAYRKKSPSTLTRDADRKIARNQTLDHSPIKSVTTKSYKIQFEDSGPPNKGYDNIRSPSPASSQIRAQNVEVSGERDDEISGQYQAAARRSADMPTPALTSEESQTVSTIQTSHCSTQTNKIKQKNKNIEVLVETCDSVAQTKIKTTTLMCQTMELDTTEKGTITESCYRLPKKVQVSNPSKGTQCENVAAKPFGNQSTMQVKQMEQVKQMKHPLPERQVVNKDALVNISKMLAHMDNKLDALDRMTQDPP